MTTLLHADSVACATFVTRNGTSLSGEIVRATHNTLTLKLDNGTPLMVARQDLTAVRFAIKDGDPIEGRLEDWQNGEYFIRVGDRLLVIEKDTVISSEVDSESSGPVQAISPDVSGATRLPAPTSPSVTPSRQLPPSEPLRSPTM